MGFLQWIATLASDFLAQGLVGATFFFDADTVNTKHWFFVNTLGEIIFFIAFVQMMYYVREHMTWIIWDYSLIYIYTSNSSAPCNGSSKTSHGSSSSS